ncbi:exosome complex RNA-binding protein Csl4 [Candidatus Micrarchaeota archaeon]|nr:exosome complex RNA-binding protein Csl4 [Candidatus Micrarchaeota archaeon]
MSREIVVPGESLGMEEEFFGNEKTFAENGNVYSMVLGEKKLVNKQVQVVTSKFARMLKEGDIVYGRVEDLYDSVSLILIQSADNSLERKAIGSTYAYLRITEINRGGGFIKNFREFLKMGDIVKGRIIEITPLGTYITISEENLGVVRARCSRCRDVLSQRGRLLVCQECGNKESRKLATP